MRGSTVMRAGHDWAVSFSPEEIADALRSCVEAARCLQGPLHRRHDEPDLQVVFHIRDGKPHATVSVEYDPGCDGKIVDCLDAILAEDAGRQYAQAVRDCFALPAVRAAAALWGRECFLRSLALHPADALSMVSWVVDGVGEGRVMEVGGRLARALVAAVADRGDPRNWLRFVTKEG